MKNNIIDILFLGDIVGRPGRLAVKNYLSRLENKPDFIIANIENASHGFGLTERNYNDIVEFGVDALTSGNHIWDKKEIFNYIDKANKLVRPLNYPKGTPGVGSRIFKTENFSIGVISLLGRVFMAPIDSPWGLIEEEIKKIQYETPIIIIDFHAEATAEKICLGYFADNLGVSAVIGTHTHVQTADERILDGGTAYITDVGSCCAYNSVIGMDIETSLKRLLTGLPEKYEISDDERAEINGVLISVSINTGSAENIKRIKVLYDEV